MVSSVMNKYFFRGVLYRDDIFFRFNHADTGLKSDLHVFTLDCHGSNQFSNMEHSWQVFLRYVRCYPVVELAHANWQNRSNDLLILDRGEDHIFDVLYFKEIVDFRVEWMPFS